MMLLLSLLKVVIIEFIFGISKDDAISIMHNSNLSDKTSTL